MGTYTDEIDTDPMLQQYREFLESTRRIAHEQAREARQAWEAREGAWRVEGPLFEHRGRVEISSGPEDSLIVRCVRPGTGPECYTSIPITASGNTSWVARREIQSVIPEGTFRGYMPGDPSRVFIRVMDEAAEEIPQIPVLAVWL
jgi:hypothetical protein